MLASLRTIQPLTRALPRAAAPSMRSLRFPTPARTFAVSSSANKVSIRYTAEHEWVKYDDAASVGTIGITDYAQKSLGDVVYVELPSEGSEVNQGGESGNIETIASHVFPEQIGAVESVKAASDIYSPITGQIQKVNDKLGDEPGLLNKSPEDKGWLCEIRLTNPAQFEELLDDAAYKKLTEDA